MNRFDAFRLSANAVRNKKLLACYLPFDDPAVCKTIGSIYADTGVDIIEVGMPCSNPCLDGPVVANSMQRSFLQNPGLNGLDEYLLHLRNKAKNSAVVIMGYESELEIESLINDVGDHIDGFLSVGRPLDAPVNWKKNGRTLHNICFVSNKVPEEEVLLATESSGYIMLQAVDGETGARSELGDVSHQIKKLKSAQTQSPVLLGFGISEPDQVEKALSMGADGVVIGSKCLDLAVNQGVKALESFLKEVRGILDEFR